MIEHMQQAGIRELVAAGDGTGRLTPETIAAGGPYQLFEREDDWCATAYFYLDNPDNDLPPIIPYTERVADLYRVSKFVHVLPTGIAGVPAQYPLNTTCPQ